MRLTLRLPSTLLLAATTALSLAAPAARAADEAPLHRLAVCGESWLDWKQDPAAGQRFGTYFLDRFEAVARSPAWRPKAALTVFGLPVVQVFPESVGMARGFSVELRGSHDSARRAMEAAIGRTMRCEKGDGTLDCEARLAERRTAFVITSDEGRGTQTLVGCFYDYQP